MFLYLDICSLHGFTSYPLPPLLKLHSLVPSCLFILWPPTIKQGHVRDWDQSWLSQSGGLGRDHAALFLDLIGFTFLVTFPLGRETRSPILSLGGVFKPSSYIFFYWRLLTVSFLLGMELQVHVSLCAHVKGATLHCSTVEFSSSPSCTWPFTSLTRMTPTAM